MENVDDRGIYEIGFLVSPLITPEDLPAKIEQIIVSGITALGGEALVPATFKTITLAYPIKVLEGGKRDTYTTAHFGSLGFKMESVSVPELHTNLKLKKEIIRFLILSGLEQMPDMASEEVATGASVEVAGGEPVEMAEIDKEIDELLAEAV